jgi:hypothetical protein
MPSSTPTSTSASAASSGADPRRAEVDVVPADRASAAAEQRQGRTLEEAKAAFKRRYVKVKSRRDDSDRSVRKGGLLIVAARPRLTDGQYEAGNAGAADRAAANLRRGTDGVRPHCRPSRTRSSCVHRHAAGRDYAALLQLESTEFD